MDVNDMHQNFDHLNMMGSLNSPSNGFNIFCGLGSANSSSSGGGCGVGEIFQTAQQFVSTNSFELNVATSLSDDSGVPLTNSSISSGDSYRLGMCKLELELVESDGEVSQFDSLENSSDGGMSAENFNTLKKGPLAPIDPPPEFQDSPQTTMLRSKLLQNYAFNLSEHLIVTALNDWLPLKKIDCQNHNINEQRDEFVLKSTDNRGIKLFTNHNNYMNNYYTKHIYASDSLLNKCYNIYDDPDDNLITSSYDNKNDTSANVIPVEEQHGQDEFDECKNYSQYLKPTDQFLTPSSANHQSNCKVYDYNFHYALKKNYQKEFCYSQQCSNEKTPSSTLYSPLQHHRHNHHHHHSNGSNMSSLNRPNSRNSLNSRLSSSHNSLTVPNANKADDSIFITQAMSHDALLSREISDFYNVPIGADIYSFPVDMIKSSSPPLSQTVKDFYNHKRDIGVGSSSSNVTGKLPISKGRFKNTRNNKKRRRNNNTTEATGIDKYGSKIRATTSSKTSHKRHSVPENTITPLHMTLDEVKRFYHSLYSSTSGSNETLSHNNNNNNNNNINNNKNGHIKTILNETTISDIVQDSNNTIMTITTINNTINTISTTTTTTINHNTKTVNLKNISNDKSNKYNNSAAHSKEEIRNHPNITTNNKYTTTNHQTSEKKSQFFINLNLKQKFCSIFRFRKNNDNRRTTSSMFEPPDYISNNHSSNRTSNVTIIREDNNKFSSRALPPLPNKNSLKKLECINNTYNKKDVKKSEFNSTIHFASNIEKVKDYGWYWGPISSEAAEKVLSNEPDGSFIVRDSSDDHYIFSLSFKLNNCVRHVRIEQDQGTFSFGSYAKFKSQTITEFIEKAVEHSRSGRYLFFLHRRPEHGPMRVQLTNPVSRFKHIQSLQHMCRFVILKAVVRKDLIPNLPLPRRLLDYLSYKHCYSEQVECDSSSQSQSSGDGVV